MFEFVSSQLKPSEFYILSCEKGLGRRPRPFSQLRMRAPRALSYTESLAVWVARHSQNTQKPTMPKQLVCEFWT